MATINWNMVTALATIVYVVGTFLLWWTIYKQLQAMRDAFKLSFLQLYVQTTQPTQSIPGRTNPNILQISERRLHRSEYENLIKRVFPKEYASLIAPPNDQVTKQEEHD